MMLNFDESIHTWNSGGDAEEDIGCESFWTAIDLLGVWVVMEPFEFYGCGREVCWGGVVVKTS